MRSLSATGEQLNAKSKHENCKFTVIDEMIDQPYPLVKNFDYFCLL
jgi:hypothetical protein